MKILGAILIGILTAQLAGLFGIETWTFWWWVFIVVCNVVLITITNIIIDVSTAYEQFKEEIKKRNNDDTGTGNQNP